MLVIFVIVLEPLGNQPDMSWLNEDAPENMPLASSKTVDTSHLYNGWLNADASWNIPSIVVTLLTDQSFRDWSNVMAPLNIFLIFDTSCVFQFDMSLLNCVAPSNMLSMVVTFDTSGPHLYNDWSNADASWNIPSIVVTSFTDQSFNGWLKIDAPLNIFFMVVTSCVFQFDMSWLKFEQSWNMLSIVVTFDTSHCEIFWLKSRSWNVKLRSVIFCIFQLLMALLLSTSSVLPTLFFVLPIPEKSIMLISILLLLRQLSLK